MKRKITALILAVVCVFSLFGCSAEPVDVPLTDFSENEKAEIKNDISGDTNLDDTIKYAAEIDDIAQSYYTKSDRSAYVMKNSDMMLVHSLTAKHNGASLYDSDGNIYFEDTFNVSYADAEGNVFSSDESESEGRVNVTKLGEYYRECHIRDFSFNDNAKVDKTFHLYGDRLYAQFSLLCETPVEGIRKFFTSIKIPKNKISAVQFRDDKGIHNKIDGVIGSYSIEYLSFDITDVGIVGFIIPSDKNIFVSVENSADDYIVSVGLEFNDISLNDINGNGNGKNKSLTFGLRVYTDKTHSFDSIDKEARLERNPLADITVNGGNGEGVFLGYDSLSGAYLFAMKGTDFNTAYQNPDLQFSLPVTIKNDSADRNIYIRSCGDNGCLEAGALLDDEGTLLPVNVQVCKNFSGDGGEPFYSVEDTQYGDSIFPVSLNADEVLSFTLLNLYQNWGKYPLKQLSSIEFHVPYYHLSTGTTETNCIAPYFVFGKDGWTLPDFRTASGTIWADQPQFNSVGILKFMTGRNGKDDVYSEYTHSEISSVGQTYSDITNTFYSDDGSYVYTLRHVEFPQTDENRTYYTLDVEFIEDKTFNNFRKDFDLFYFDGRSVCFDKIDYLDAENKCVSADVDTSKKTQYYVLGDNAPYWGFYDVSDIRKEELDNHFGANFAMIIKNSSIVIGGEQSDIPFVFRESSVDETSAGALTLDADKLEFKKGDTISIDMILLPWGQGTEESDAQVLSVREDSALKPVCVTVHTGKAVEDAFVPVVECEDNKAEFTLSGGKGNIAVRVDGFSGLQCPDIYLKTENEWQKVDLSSSNGYDGYSVFMNPDGTYGFSFVYNSQSVSDKYTFRAEQ